MGDIFVGVFIVVCCQKRLSMVNLLSNTSHIKPMYHLGLIRCRMCCIIDWSQKMIKQKVDQVKAKVATTSTTIHLVEFESRKGTNDMSNAIVVRAVKNGFIVDLDVLGHHFGPLVDCKVVDTKPETG